MMKILNNPIKYWWQALILAVLAVMFASVSPKTTTNLPVAQDTSNLISNATSPILTENQTTGQALASTPAPTQPGSAILPPLPEPTAASTMPSIPDMPKPAQQKPAPIVASAMFFPVFPLGASQDTAPRFVPIASNHPLDTDHVNIARAVILLHDFSRDAGREIAKLMSLAGTQNATTIILAPQFLLESDLARFATQLPDKGRDFLRWNHAAWSKGADSLPMQGQRGISSFTVIDLLLMLLGDRDRFPNLTDIVIAGHGEGGDFTQRYAATGQAPDILAQQGVAIRFVAANPSSYLYITAARPNKTKPAATTRPQTDALSNAAPEPAAEDSRSEPSSCAEINRWPYGLDELNDYAKKSGSNETKLRYPTRKISILIGDQIARSDPAPDTSCAARAQGADRLARARNYANYLQSLFSDEIANTQSFRSIPGTGYDSFGIWSSICGMISLFGDGQCGKRTFSSTTQDN